MSKSPFLKTSVAYPLQADAFTHLSERDRQRLVRLMARIAEKSYRRGFQHGVEIGDRRTVDPYSFRFRRSLDQSPFTDSPMKTTAVERLFMECGVLDEIGLHDPAIRGAP